MSQYDCMTQEAVNRLSENLEEMPRNMRQFSSVFRDLYRDQAVGGHSEAAVKFRKLRDDTRRDAMVYLKCILPATTNFIRSVKEYFEYYEALSYDDWCELLPDILEETKTHKHLAQTVLDLYQEITAPLKKRQDRARVVMAEFVNLQSVYYLSEGSPRGNMALAIASEKQYDINKQAARTVAETLIPALSRFVDGLQKVARFFGVIENELESFEDKSEGDTDERKQSHYKVIRNSAREVKSLCAAFYGVLPDVRTDFEALPNENTDQNYVDKWLEKTLADIRSQTTLKALLGTSSVMAEKEVDDTGRQSNRTPPKKERPALTPVDDPVPTWKNKPPIPPKKRQGARPASTTITDPVPPRYDQTPTHKGRPVSAPITYPIPTMRYVQVQINKTRLASTSLDYVVRTSTSTQAPPIKNTPAATAINDPVPTKNNIQASTSKNRPASTPVDNPVPTSENKPAKTPKIKRKIAPEDNRTPLISKNKRSSSKDDLIERKQQRCRWRCSIM